MFKLALGFNICFSAYVHAGSKPLPQALRLAGTTRTSRGLGLVHAELCLDKDPLKSLPQRQFLDPDSLTRNTWPEFILG